MSINHYDMPSGKSILYRYEFNLSIYRVIPWCYKMAVIRNYWNSGHHKNFGEKF